LTALVEPKRDDQRVEDDGDSSGSRPKRSTVVKMKVSDTEIRAEIAGTFTVKDPVNSVSAARMNHSTPGALAESAHRDWPATSRPAAATRDT